ncbi:MAG: DUF3052 family protein [Chloroflexi bacterium]|nr:DUF3052 family protein [Chloroflexota bacterium]
MTAPRPPAGYSGTPLPQKLGIKPGSRLALIAAPDGFDETLGALPPDVTVRTDTRAAADVIVYFTTRRSDFTRRLERFGRAIAPDGALWVSWPKRASGVATDVTEDVVREVALPTGLVDNKVAAIDETWSALRLVWRRELRAGLQRG